MRMQEIELSIGECVIFGDHVLTVLDIEQEKAVLRIDPRDADSAESPGDSVGRFASPEFVAVPR